MGNPSALKPVQDTDAPHHAPEYYEHDVAAAGSSDGPPSYDDSLAPAPTAAKPNTQVFDHTQAPCNAAKVGPEAQLPIDRGEITVRMDAPVRDPKELYEYVDTYLSNAPPRPMVRIQGYHDETVNEEIQKQRRDDFDIFLSFQACLGKPRTAGFWQSVTAARETDTFRGSSRRSRATVSEDEGGAGVLPTSDDPARNLRDWCEDFCESSAVLKVFRVTRQVEGWDNKLIETQLEAIVRSTHYRGFVDISFPVEQRIVDVYTPHWVNEWRTGWVRFLFYFTFLWVLTWPVLFFLTKWWDVYSVMWRFSVVNADGTKAYASISEEQWVENHKELVRKLAVEKFKGDASNHPLVQESAGSETEHGRCCYPCPHDLGWGGND